MKKMLHTKMSESMLLGLMKSIGEFHFSFRSNETQKESTHHQKYVRNTKSKAFKA